MDRGDRRYFHYIQDTPVLVRFLGTFCGYEVRREKPPCHPEGNRHRNLHQKGHEVQPQSLCGSKDGLTPTSQTPGDFQFRQMRILEFPRYAGLLGTSRVVHASFGWWLISPINSFDYVYYVYRSRACPSIEWGTSRSTNYGANRFRSFGRILQRCFRAEYGEENEAIPRGWVDDYLQRSGE
jgi:hypothetical protein